MDESQRKSEVLRGRGASWNPKNRFEKLEYIVDEDADRESPGPVRTVFLRDPTREIIAKNQSPDVSFEASINPYRGCEHGCIYCFARPSHEYLGFSAGLDFETRILVKESAPELLRESLMSPSWQPKVLAVSGVTDPFQPIERKLEITRRCLGVLAEFRNPVMIITKNHLVTRDIDHLSELARFHAAAVMVSVTTLDPELANQMEPRTSTPQMRLQAIRRLNEAGIPAGVMVAPVIPAITDHELPAILEAAAASGARSAGMVLLRLPWTVAPLFEQWLTERFPDRKEKVLQRIRSMRGGRLYDAHWGIRAKGTGIWAEQLQSLFDVSVRRLGMNREKVSLSTDHFRRPEGDQRSLF